MAGADRALGAFVAIAVGVFALAFPFVASGYHIYQGAQVLILAVALLGLNLLTGFNGQISLGHGAFFAIGGYGAAILMVKFGVPILGGDPAGEHRVLHRRLSVRLSGAPVRRPLSRARHFRARRRDPADPDLQGLRRLSPAARRASRSRSLTRHSGLRLSADQWLYLVCLACARGALLGGAQSRARADRAGSGRHPRSADRRRDDGRQRGALQDDVLRRQRALCRRSWRLERASRSASFRRRASGSRSRSPFSSASSSGGLVRSAARCSAPCSSSSCPISPTSSPSVSAKAPRRCRARFTARCSFW